MQLRIEAIVDVSDEDLANAIIFNVFHPKRSQLVGALWEIGIMVDLDIQSQSEWYKLELLAIEDAELKARNKALRECIEMVEAALNAK
jgi:hypothetical protein